MTLGMTNNLKLVHVSGPSSFLRITRDKRQSDKWLALQLVSITISILESHKNGHRHLFMCQIVTGAMPIINRSYIVTVAAETPGNRRHIPEAVKERWVTASRHMKSEDIARVTGTSLRTVNRVPRLANRTGSVTQKPLASGRPRHLSHEDVEVS